MQREKKIITCSRSFFEGARFGLMFGKDYNENKIENGEVIYQGRKVIFEDVDDADIKEIITKEFEKNIEDSRQ